MSYKIFVVPNALYFYPKHVINLLNELGSSSVAITMDKGYLSDKCPEAVYLERIQSTGELENNSQMIESVKKANPQAVVLDNCFWDKTELNSWLLENLFLIQQEIPFLLVNVLPISVFLQKNTQKIVRLDKASHMYYPECKINIAPWSVIFGSSTIYYKNTSLENDVGTHSLSSVDSALFKTAFKLYQGIQTLKLRNDLDLFISFLEGLRVKHLNKYLLRFVLTVHKYFFETAGERHFMKDVSLSATEMNDLFERLNRPVLFLIMNNRDLFDEIVSFFE